MADKKANSTIAQTLADILSMECDTLDQKIGVLIILLTIVGLNPFQPLKASEKVAAGAQKKGGRGGRGRGGGSSLEEQPAPTAKPPGKGSDGGRGFSKGKNNSVITPIPEETSVSDAGKAVISKSALPDLREQVEDALKWLNIPDVSRQANSIQPSFDESFVKKRYRDKRQAVDKALRFYASDSCSDKSMFLLVNAIQSFRIALKDMTDQKFAIVLNPFTAPFESEIVEHINEFMAQFLKDGAFDSESVLPTGFLSDQNQKFK